jgi:hypothetical protein
LVGRFGTGLRLGRIGCGPLFAVSLFIVGVWFFLKLGVVHEIL